MATKITFTLLAAGQPVPGDTPFHWLVKDESPQPVRGVATDGKGQFEAEAGREVVLYLPSDVADANGVRHHLPSTPIPFRVQKGSDPHDLGTFDYMVGAVPDPLAWVVQEVTEAVGAEPSDLFDAILSELADDTHPPRPIADPTLPPKPPKQVWLEALGDFVTAAAAPAAVNVLQLLTAVIKSKLPTPDPLPPDVDPAVLKACEDLVAAISQLVLASQPASGDQIVKSLGTLAGDPASPLGKPVAELVRKSIRDPLVVTVPSGKPTPRPVGGAAPAPPPRPATAPTPRPLP